MTQTKTQVLLVAGDTDVKNLIHDLLNYDQIQTAVTETLAKAAQFLQSNPLPDLLILDLSSTDAESLDFLQQMRAHDEFAKLPVLVLTAVPDPDQVRGALQAGANRYLTKLFISKNLLKTVQEMLV